MDAAARSRTRQQPSSTAPMWNRAGQRSVAACPRWLCAPLLPFVEALFAGVADGAAVGYGADNRVTAHRADIDGCCRQVFAGLKAFLGRQVETIVDTLDRQGILERHRGRL